MTNVKNAQEIAALPFMPQGGISITPETGDVVMLDDSGEGLEGLMGAGHEDQPVEVKIVNDGEITFNIGAIPGAPDDVVLEDEDDLPKVVEEVISEPEEPVDDWEWEKSHGVKTFLNWMQKMIDGIPKHSGKDTTGLERAIAYFERLNAEISRAMRKDFKREIDAAKAEEARGLIEDGLKRLRSRLDKLMDKKYKKSKKAGTNEYGFVKNAETTMTGQMTVQVPYFISFVARTCIDSVVQGGKDMKDVFIKLAKEYKLDKREKVLVAQLIRDMGYPVTIDRLRITDGVLDMSDGEGEFHKQYFA